MAKKTISNYVNMLNNWGYLLEIWKGYEDMLGRKKLKFKTTMQFIGDFFKIKSYYNTIKIFALTSDKEGFANSMLEEMGTCCPNFKSKCYSKGMLRDKGLRYDFGANAKHYFKEFPNLRKEISGH